MINKTNLSHQLLKSRSTSVINHVFNNFRDQQQNVRFIIESLKKFSILIVLVVNIKNKNFYKMQVT